MSPGFNEEQLQARPQIDEQGANDRPSTICKQASHKFDCQAQNLASHQAGAKEGFSVLKKGSYSVPDCNGK